MSGSTQIEADVIRRAYEAFNAQDMEGALALLDPDVEWPNGIEGGFVRGREAVRDYWARQWQQYTPTVVPLTITATEDGRQVVEVHQVVRERKTGVVRVDRTVRQVFELRDGLVTRLVLQNTDGSPLPPSSALREAEGEGIAH